MRLITGLQAVREAIRVHGDKLEKVYLVREGGPQIDAVARFAEGRGATVTRIDRLELDRMARGARHQGAIAHAPELGDSRRRRVQAQALSALNDCCVNANDLALLI